MKRTILFLVLVLALLLIGCSKQSDYSAYNQPNGQQQPYVGGGCGVAPSADYAAMPEISDAVEF